MVRHHNNYVPYPTQRLFPRPYPPTYLPSKPVHGISPYKERADCVQLARFARCALPRFSRACVIAWTYRTRYHTDSAMNAFLPMALVMRV